MDRKQVSLSAMPAMKFPHWALIISSCLLYTNILTAQQKRMPEQGREDVWKNRLSPAIGKKDSAYFLSGNPQFYTIGIADRAAFLIFAAGNKEQIKILRQYGDQFLVIRCTPFFLRQMLSKHLVISADEALMRPTSDGGVISFDHTVNAIEAAHHLFPAVNGSGQLVSVKENRMDTTDIDLSGRHKNTGVTASTGNTHATVMTTLIAGGGHSSYKGKGVAFKADYTSSDFTGVLPDADDIYRSNDIRVQNHSYGAALQPWYGANARAFDLSANSNPSLLHVFSSGNSGTIIPGEGVYAGINGYSNLTGNMKMAKNTLLVGAIDSLLQVPAASSRGPAYDGRLKPEIVAFAEDGTSGSAALVSGSAVLLQQFYEEKEGLYANAELIKAILVNSADDVVAPGLDFVSGYGNLNLYRSLLTVSDSRFMSGTLMPFSSEEFTISIPQHAQNFKVTLAWNDPAAPAFSSKALVNDLDLTVEKLSSGETWLPWVLNSYPHTDSLALPAVRKRDTLNNIEQVGIEEAGGEYRVTVRSTILRNVRQSFALAWQYDMPDMFLWMAPTEGSRIEAGKKYFLRWNQTFPAGTFGEIQFKRSAQSDWLTLVNQKLDEPLSWQVPEVFGNAELRMIIATDTLYSGTFTISPMPIIRAGWICDSVLLYWSPTESTVHWNVYRFNSDSMQLIAETPDTSVVISGQGTPYMAVAPVIQGREGLRSETINYDQQNAGCYINNFLADLVNDREGRLTLQLGAIYGVKKIRILKIDNQITELTAYSTSITNSYVYTDMNLHPGLNRYQVEIEREGADPIFSQVETIYYNNNRPYILFPNPVRRGEPLNLLQETVNDLECRLFDATGRLLRKQILTDKVAFIQTSDLSAGMYHLIIVDEHKQSHRYKFIVR